jgi:hypothetical protein
VADEVRANVELGPERREFWARFLEVVLADLGQANGERFARRGDRLPFGYCDNRYVPGLRAEATQTLGNAPFETRAARAPQGRLLADCGSGGVTSVREPRVAK